MAHGTKERSSTIYVKLKHTKKGEKATFIYSENKVESEGNYLEGYISNIIPNSYEYEGKTVPTYEIHMVDQGQRYEFSTSWTSLARTILNCLASVQHPGKISIQVVPPETKKDYPSIFVENDEEILKWTWKYEELSKFIDLDDGKKVYDRLNEYLDDHIEKELGPKFREALARMSHNGNFASATEEKDELLEEVKKTTPGPGEPGHSTGAKDIDTSSQMQESTDESFPTAETETPPEPEEQDDLPF